MYILCAEYPPELVRDRLQVNLFVLILLGL